MLSSKEHGSHNFVLRILSSLNDNLFVATATQQQHGISNQKCGPMPNVMAAVPNIGGALCSTPQFG